MLLEVTNLNLSLIEADVRRLFLAFGEVGSIQIFRDKRTNRSFGRAHVVMPVEKEAQKAIVGLQGSILAGKSINITNIPSSEEEEWFRPTI